VKSFLLITVILLLAFSPSGCHKKETSPAVELQTETKKTDFVPPSDSSLTIDQMKKWIQCNPYLDSLSVLYKDSFAAPDAARQTKVQEDFVKAQDRICVRLGMQGGYAEYLWTLKSAGNSKNAKIMDSLKLTVFSR
jgi:hypothetical protein